MSIVGAPNGAMYERALIASSLAKLGIDGSCEIVLPDHPDIVETTAAETLQRFLCKAGLNIRVVSESKASKPNRFLIGMNSSLSAIRSLSDAGELSIREVSAEDDGFHLKRTGGSFVLAGANPRGVLYAVYAFEDFVRTGAEGPPDILRVPHFRKRGNGQYYYPGFNPYVNILTEDFPEEKAAFLSRMGINQMTDQGVGGCLHEFVTSDVFPFQIPPRPDFQRKVKAMSSLCGKYGIDMYLFLNEPALARLAADPALYPKEALGKVNRPWGNPRVDSTLCVSSPIVHDHLRNMMRKLVREYPDIKGVQFYNMDGDTWICTPDLCERCKVVCTDSPGGEHNPWETQAALITVLADSAHEENPDFDFRLWSTVHFHGERLEKMVRTATGYNSLLSCWNGSDRDVMVPDIAKLDPGYLASLRQCEARSVPMYMLSEYNNIEAVPKSLPFPFHVCDALKKYAQWGVRYLTEIYGVIPEHNPINAIVTREFQWDPDQDPREFLAGLSVRQFGEAAGRLTYRAWEEMEKAFDVWNDAEFGPLSGSQHMLSIGTSVGLPHVILPSEMHRFDEVLEALTNVEPWRGPAYEAMKEAPFLEKMTVMSAHLSRAANHAKEAIAAADEGFIATCWHEGVTGRPTYREYAELNYGSIAIADVLCRQRCSLLRAYLLLAEIERARSAGDAYRAAENEEKYREVIRADIGLQKELLELLAGFASKRPCYTRTSLTEREISDLFHSTRSRIEKRESFLEEAPA